MLCFRLIYTLFTANVIWYSQAAAAQVTLSVLDIFALAQELKRAHIISPQKFPHQNSNCRLSTHELELPCARASSTLNVATTKSWRWRPIRIRNHACDVLVLKNVKKTAESSRNGRASAHTKSQINQLHNFQPFFSPLFDEFMWLYRAVFIVCFACLLHLLFCSFSYIYNFLLFRMLNSKASRERQCGRKQARGWKIFNSFSCCWRLRATRDRAFSIG